MKRFISLALTLIFALSFTAFADDGFELRNSTVKNGASNVYVKEGKISISFNDEVYVTPVEIPAAEEGGEPTYTYPVDFITITENETEFTEFTAERNAVNNKVIDITFVADLKYSKNYVIDISECEDKDGVKISGTTAIAFTTEAKPAVQLNGITHTVGVGSVTLDGEIDENAMGDIVTAVLNLDGEDEIATDDNLLQGFKVSLNNISTDAETVNIICALYDSNNIIKRVLITSKEIAALSTDAVELGTIIDSSTFEDGSYAKIYVWDSIENKSPFVGSTKIAIVAPVAE